MDRSKGQATPPAGGTGPFGNKTLLRLLLAGLALAGVIVAGIVALRVVRSHRQSGPVAAAEAKAEASQPPPAAGPTPPKATPSAAPGSSNASGKEAAPAAAGEIVESPVPPPPAMELLAVVQKLSISAVKPGPNGRALIDGKMIYIGEQIGHGLQLFEIKDERLVFIDDQGARYTRRF